MKRMPQVLGVGMGEEVAIEQRVDRADRPELDSARRRARACGASSAGIGPDREVRVRRPPREVGGVERRCGRRARARRRRRRRAGRPRPSAGRGSPRSCARARSAPRGPPRGPPPAGRGSRRAAAPTRVRATSAAASPESSGGSSIAVSRRSSAAGRRRRRRSPGRRPRRARSRAPARGRRPLRTIGCSAKPSSVAPGAPGAEPVRDRVRRRLGLGDAWRRRARRRRSRTCGRRRATGA